MKKRIFALLIATFMVLVSMPGMVMADVGAQQKAFTVEVQVESDALVFYDYSNGFMDITLAFADSVRFTPVVCSSEIVNVTYFLNGVEYDTLAVGELGTFSWCSLQQSGEISMDIELPGGTVITHSFWQLISIIVPVGAQQKSEAANTVEVQVESDALLYYHFSNGIMDITLAFVDNIRFTPIVFSSEIVNVTYFLDGVEYDTLAVGEFGTFCIFDLYQSWEISMNIELSDGTVITHSFQYLIIVVEPVGAQQKSEAAFVVDVQVESDALVYYHFSNGTMDITLAFADNIRFTPVVSGEIVNVTYFLGGVEYDTLAVGELGTFCIFDLHQNWEICMYIELSDGTVITHSFWYIISIIVPAGAQQKFEAAFAVDVQVEADTLLYYHFSNGIMDITLTCVANIRFTPIVSSEIVNITYFLNGVEYDTLAVGELGTFFKFDLHRGGGICMYIELSDGTIITHSFWYIINIIVPC